MKSLLSILFSLGALWSSADEYATIVNVSMNGEKYFAAVEIWDDNGTSEDLSDDISLTIGVVANVNPTGSDAILDERGKLKLEELDPNDFQVEIISTSQHESTNGDGEVEQESKVRVFHVVILLTENREPILSGPITYSLEGEKARR
ncbi:MAG: hypothetical protein EP346_06245 [Bacteroidetes bacterium]|nr:MAG: hypothetical protein EP346_06245 [Bacteroidota bacterium]